MWMTSASELFHNRRYRFGVRQIDFSGFDSSLPDSNSSSSSHQHHRTGNRRHHRHDLDVVCDNSVSRRIHRRRIDHSEHDPVHPEQSSQSPSGSIINSDDFRSIQRRRATGSDRLPGSVLLARERLLERLRGVSVSGSSSSPGNIRQPSNGITSRENNVLEETSQSTETLERIRRRRRKHHPPGLDEDALKLLELQVFKNDDGGDDERLRECTICLEGFDDGDKVIWLHCTHGFHSGCLFPWIRECGACPNCRKPVLVG